MNTDRASTGAAGTVRKRRQIDDQSGWPSGARPLELLFPKGLDEPRAVEFAHLDVSGDQMPRDGSGKPASMTSWAPVSSAARGEVSFARCAAREDEEVPDAPVLRTVETTDRWQRTSSLTT